MTLTRVFLALVLLGLAALPLTIGAGPRQDALVGALPRAHLIGRELPMTPVAVDFPNARDGFVAVANAQDAALLATSDGGAAFVRRTLPPGWIPAAIQFSTTTRGTVLFKRCSGSLVCHWALWTTRTAGRSWHAVWRHGPMKWSEMALQMLSPHVGFLAASGAVGRVLPWTLAPSSGAQWSHGPRHVLRVGAARVDRGGPLWSDLRVHGGRDPRHHRRRACLAHATQAATDD